MAMNKRMQNVGDMVVLTAGLLLVSWFYYELYQGFRGFSLGF